MQPATRWRNKRLPEKSRLEQLSGALTSKGFTGFDDLTPVLLAAKGQANPRLFSKTDTHWTDVGAFIAYREIMGKLTSKRPELAKSLVPLSRDAYTLQKVPGFSGDLAGMMGLKGELTEDFLALIPKSQRSATIAASLGLALNADLSYASSPVRGVSINLVRSGVVSLENSARCPGPSLAVYHDSFLKQLAPWFAETFCKTTFFYTSHHMETAFADRAWIATSHPTFVILETVERFAVHAFPKAVLAELSAPDTGAPQK